MSLWYWEVFPRLWILDTDVFFNLSWLECLKVSTPLCKSVITEIIIIKMIGCLFYLNQMILLSPGTMLKLSRFLFLFHLPFSSHWEFPSPVCEWPRGERAGQRGPVLEAAAHRHHRLQEAQLAAAELPGEGSASQGWAAGSWGGGRPGSPSAAASPQSLPRPPEAHGGRAASAGPPTDSSGELLYPRMTCWTTSTQCPPSQSTDPTDQKVKVALSNYYFSVNPGVCAFKKYLSTENLAVFLMHCTWL